MKYFVTVLLVLTPIGVKAATLSVPTEVQLVDRDIEIEATGLQPGQLYEIHARTEDKLGRAWSSWARFEAGKNGGIDFSAKPLAGTYSVPQSQGLWWSMVPEGFATEEEDRVFFRPANVFQTRISLHRNGQVIASKTFSRALEPESLSVESIRSKNLYGDLIFRKGNRPLPAILYLGGSEGGLSTGEAKLLAAKGFAVLVLAYHGVSPLPPDLIEIPLEYFDNAIEFLKNHSAVDSKRIYVFGTSKGGELALLLASRNTSIRGVVARVPSGIVWQGLRNGEAPSGSSWSLGGKPLPYLPYIFEPDDFKTSPYKLRVGYERGLSVLARNPQAEIEVEKIRGPILLISGTDDQIWPSETLTALIERRLREHGFAFEVINIVYSGAGHFIGLPNWPTTGRIFGSMTAGGKQQADGVASYESWREILRFLELASEVTD